jgi:hypothetical protein
MDRNIKLLFSVGIILLVVMGVALFFTFRQSQTNHGGSGGALGRGGTLPNGNGTASGNNINISGSGSDVPFSAPITDEEKKKLVQLSKDPVIGPTMNKDGNRVLYFKQGTGNLYETTLDGNGGENRLSNVTIKNISAAQWSQSKTYALVSSLATSTINNFWVHITSTTTIQTGGYQSTLLSAAFSPSEDKLASIVKAGSLYAITISNPDGKSAKNIFSTDIPDFEISWPSKTILTLKTKSSAFAQSLFGTIPVAGGPISVISSEEKGFDIVWAPDGVRYLAGQSLREGRDIKLEIRSLDGKSDIIELSSKTLPEKCVFSKKDKTLLYCAIPANRGREPLPDAWWQKKTEFLDTLWSVNLTTGESKQLLSGGGFDMTHIFTSPNENYIFFVNKKDSTLWSLRLL